MNLDKATTNMVVIKIAMILIANAAFISRIDLII